MLFWFHLIYTIVFVGFLFVSGFLCPSEKEKYDLLSSGRKKLIAAMPYILMAIVWIFPLGNAILRADSFLSFYSRFSLELATASFFNLFIFWSCTKTGEMIDDCDWVPYLLYICYTLIKNFALNGFWMGILAEVLAIVTLIVFWIICTILQGAITPKTKEEREQDAKATADFRAQMAYERENAHILEEQARIQAEKDARTHEAYERIVLGKKTTRSYSSYSDDSSSGSSDRGTKCCINCCYHYGGVCNCKGTRYYLSPITDPWSEGCAYFYRG